MTLRNSPSPSTSFQASLPPSIQNIINNTITTITSALRNSHTSHNNTDEEMNLVLSDPNILPIFNITFNNLYDITIFIMVFIIISSILFNVFSYMNLKIQTNKLQILKPFNLIKNLYNKQQINTILPISRPKKAKESPFVGPMPLPTVLPSCSRLEGAEKGQNIMFRFRGPANSRIESSNTTLNDNETRITIVTVVEGHNRSLLPLKNIITI